MALTPDTDQFSQFLRLAFFRSPNYVPGVSGWTINQDGSVEFSNGTFRGTIGANSLLLSGSGGSTYVSITKTGGTGTIPIPAGVTTVRAEAWGHGGNGASGVSSVNGGGGGGGGEYAAESSLAVTGGGSVSYSIPAHGGGATTLTGTSVTVTANSGSDGSSGGAGGAGGTGSANAIHHNGGAGGAGGSSLAFTAGGGGGGASGSPGGAGGNGTAGTIAAGGAGGTAPGGGGGAGGNGGFNGGGGSGLAPGGGAGGADNAGNAPGIATAGQVRITYLIASGNGSLWLPPSGDVSGSSDLTSINGAYTSGITDIHLLPGDYYINGTISMPQNSSLRGPGMDIATIHQVATSGDAIAASGKNGIILAGFTVAGPAAGTGNGIHLTGAGATSASHLTLEDLAVNGFPGIAPNGIGVLLDSIILSRVTRVTSVTNRQGIQLTNSFTVSTSVDFEACFASGNTGNNYEFDGAQYCSLHGCGSDNAAIGYAFFGCQAITLNSCGTESFTSKGYVFDNCKGCCLLGAFTFNGKTIGIHVTNGSSRITVGGATETSPAGGATAFLQVDAGTTAIAWGITHITADSLAAGTTTNVDGSA